MNPFKVIIMNLLNEYITNPLKGMYHESRDVASIKGCIMTLLMYHDSTINRLWSTSHIHRFMT